MPHCAKTNELLLNSLRSCSINCFIIFRLTITEGSEVTQQLVILKDVFTIKLVSSFEPLLILQDFKGDCKGKLTCFFLLSVNFHRIKFLAIATENKIEVYAWAPKPYHKFMAFKVSHVPFVFRGGRYSR